MRGIIILSLVACCSISGCSKKQEIPAIQTLLDSFTVAVTKCQLVYDDFSTDPAWEGLNNQVTVNFPLRIGQSFGYSADTNLAGKDTGEIGGYIQSTVRPAWYAKVLEVPLGVEQPLSFSGSFTIMEARGLTQWTSMPVTMFGFFNSTEQGWRAKNFMGVRFMGFNEPDGCTFECYFGARDGSAVGEFLNQGGEMAERNTEDQDESMLFRVVPDASRHHFHFRYDPKAGDDGTMHLTIDDTKWDIRVRDTQRKRGATFNRFGMFNEQLPGRAMTIFFDDVAINGEYHNFATDPGWEVNGSRVIFRDVDLYGAHSFGYSPQTNHAGGKSPGEVGGRIWRIEEPEFFAYYADNTGPLNLARPLMARGKISFTKFSIDSGFQLGWFKGQPDQKWPTKNFIGAGADSYTAGGRFFIPMCGNRDQGSHFDTLKSPYFVADGKSHDWSIRYDPQGGEGQGVVTVTLDEQAATHALPPGAKEVGAELDRFGLIAMQQGNGKYSEIYIDDIEYTVARK